MSTITGSINVEKINKDRLFPGAKGRYLNIVLIPTPNSEYGDYMIKENLSYEARQAGEEGAILGNAKIRVAQAPAETQDQKDDLPF